MRRRVRLLLVGGLLLSSSLLPSLPARAAVVLPETPESLTRLASTVVRGTVVSRTEGFDEAVRRPVIRTEIAVTERWKGAPAERLVVQQLGSLVRGRVAGIPGDALFRRGEEVVLFLARGHGPEEGVYFVLGLAQGKYAVSRVAGVETARVDVSRLSFPHAADRATVVTGVPLDVLRARVRRAALVPPPPPGGKGVRP